MTTFPGVDALLVVAGGAIGAPARYLVDRWLSARYPGPFPLGTLVVNLTGSFLLGLVVPLSRYGSGWWLLPLAGTGFCGALTTFSTFSWQTVRLLEAGSWRSALSNVAVSLIAGLSAVTCGWWLASTIATTLA